MIQMVRQGIACAAGLALLGACALTPPRVGTDRLASGDALAASELNFGGVLEVAAGLRALDGELVLCGAWSGRTSYARYYGDPAIATGFVEIEGIGRVYNLSFMVPLREGQGLAPGRLTGCRPLGRSWEATDAERAMRIRLPYVVVERDCEDGFLGCMTTSFRQIPYPAAL